jgi:hypothetical protein
MAGLENGGNFMFCVSARAADLQPLRHFQLADMRSRRNPAGTNGVAQRAIGERSQRSVRVLHRRFRFEQIDDCGVIADFAFDG